MFAMKKEEPASGGIHYTLVSSVRKKGLIVRIPFLPCFVCPIKVSFLSKYFPRVAMSSVGNQM